ncbi:unnamed protein product [Colias eurytheme]|nr:unnamed protein product [Colias eurytheme]
MTVGCKRALAVLRRRAPHLRALFYAHIASECSAIACGRECGARRAFELHPQRRAAARVCVSARAHTTHRALVCLLYRLKPNSAHKKLSLTQALCMLTLNFASCYRNKIFC